MTNSQYSDQNNYLYLINGKISNIIELNSEYPYINKDGYKTTRFKNVFSLSETGINDERLNTCISWNRQTIQTGDLITLKGRYLKNAFLVKSLRILRRNNNSD